MNGSVPVSNGTLKHSLTNSNASTSNGTTDHALIITVIPAKGGLTGAETAICVSSICFVVILVPTIIALVFVFPDKKPQA